MSKILSLILIIINIIIITSLYSLNIIPTIFLLILVALILVINIPLLIVLFKKKKNIASILAIVYIVCGLIGITYISKPYKFLNTITANNNQTRENYYLLSKEENNLENKKIGIYVEDNELFNKAKEELKEENLIPCLSIQDMIDKLESKEIDGIFLSEFHKRTIKDGSLKVIDKIEVETKEEINSSLKLNDFTNIYITGTDSYNSNLRNEHDINIVASINFKKNEVLLTTIPSHYYITLNNGHKDLIGHSMLYGIKPTLKAVETLLNTKIEHFIKVDYSILIDVVDLIGGIEINKTLNSEETLNLIRNSKTQEQKEKNQQTVIEALINKIKNNPVLLNDNQVLEQISKSIKTNIDKQDISSIIKKQIEENPNWINNKINLDGQKQTNYTYTFGQQLIEVIEPNQQTLANASNQIKNLANN